MRSKNSVGDSVVIESLINEDTTEVLEGPSSTILERDLIVFSVRHVAPGILPLKPRDKPIMPGEPVNVIGNSYSESATCVLETKVVSKLGFDILIDQMGEISLAGFSGAPVVDASGLLVGVFSSVSTDPATGKAVLVAISNEYLKKVLAGKRRINEAKVDYGDLIFQTVLKKGATKGIKQYKRLVSKSKNYYKYNLRSANRNGLRETGEKLMEMNKLQDAIEVLTFNINVNGTYFHDYNVLAKACLLAGQKAKAIEYYKISTGKFSNVKENEAFQALRKIESSE